MNNSNQKKHRIYLFLTLIALHVTIAPLFGMFSSDNYDQRPCQGTSYKNGAIGVTGIVLGSVGCYVLARLCSAGIYSLALYRYEAELDLLARAVFNEQVIQDELIPFILEQHDRNSFFIQSKYKNYPLLYYKNSLDWYILRLWILKYIYFDNKSRHEVNVLQEKLERIRRLVVTDYRFVEEQRDFDRRERKKEKAA